MPDAIAYVKEASASPRTRSNECQRYEEENHQSYYRRYPYWNGIVRRDVV